eukprot:6178992-Pleurochrysis_carterae.AAC.2
MVARRLARRSGASGKADEAMRRPSTVGRKCSVLIVSLPARRCTLRTCLRSLKPEAVGLSAASCLRLGHIVASTNSNTLQSKRASRRMASGELCERYPVPPPRCFVLFDRARFVSQRVEHRKATIKLLLVHVCSGCSDMALGKLRQVIVPRRLRCDGRLEAVRKRRGQGERGDTTHCTSWHGRISSVAWVRRQMIEGTRDSTEVGGVGRSWARRIRGKRVRLSQGIRDCSQAIGGPRMRLNVTGERKQVEVKDPILGHQRAEEGSDTGRHVEAFGVHTKSCTEGVEFLKVATAACISHGVGCAKRRGAHGAATWRTITQAWRANAR